MKRLLKRVNGITRSSAGFTFVELMVGVALLAVLITALAGSNIYSSRTMVDSKSRLDAIQALQSELENLLAMPYDSVDTGSRSTTTGSSSWTVEDNGTYKTILVRVAYSPAGGDTIRDSVVTFRQAP